MSAKHTFTARTYLVWLTLAALVSFCVAWIYILLIPMAFLEEAYPVSAAVHQMIDDCDLGSLVIFGDSEAQVGIDPDRLPERAANISFAAASPIELYYVADSMARCGRLPKRVVISFAIPNFTKVSPFLWQHHVRFGFLGLHQLEEIGAVSAKLGDHAFAETMTEENLKGSVRDLLYSIHFPPFYFSGLANGRVFLRYLENQRKVSEVLALRGYVPYQHEIDPVAVGDEVRLASFVPIPIQDFYFDRMLALLSARGLQVDFVLMPLSQPTYRRMNRQVLQDFSTYLARYAARYPNFRFLGRVTSPWPAEYFSDQSHLNPRGADLFSLALGGCLQLDAHECILGPPNRSFTQP